MGLIGEAKHINLRYSLNSVLGFLFKVVFSQNAYISIKGFLPMLSYAEIY